MNAPKRLPGWAYALIALALATLMFTWGPPLRPAPTPEAVTSEIASALRATGEWQAAADAFRDYLTTNPEDANAFYQLGLLNTLLSQLEAQSALSQAAALDPAYADEAQDLRSMLARISNSEDPAYNAILIGQALAALQEWDLAQAAFEQSTQLAPEYAEAWAFLGWAQTQNGADGQPALQRALELNPDSLSANILSGLYWRKEDRPDLALVYLQAANLQSPENPALLTDIGQTLMELGNLPDALPYFLAVTELLPNDPQSWVVLAHYSLDHEIYVEEVGLPAARQSIIVSGQSPTSLALLGKAYSLLGDDFNARKFLELALQADPELALAHLYLGQYELSLQQMGSAQAHLLAAQEYGQDSLVGEQAEFLLARFFPGTP